MDRRRGSASNDDWICVDERGKRLTPTALGHGYRRIRSKVGVGTTFHGLRHTHITDLLMNGIPVKAVSERAGHASAAMTEDRYGHVTPTIQSQSALVVDRLMRAAYEMKEAVREKLSQQEQPEQ